MESFVNEQKVLFRVDFLSVTSGHRFQRHRVGLGVKIQNILEFNAFTFFLVWNYLYMNNR